METLCSAVNAKSGTIRDDREANEINLDMSTLSGGSRNSARGGGGGVDMNNR